MVVDAIVVLGHELLGEKLSEVAKERLEKALEIYKKEKTKILLSGGYSLRNKFGKGPSEVALMKEYVVEKGIAPEDILLEESSRDTQGSACFTKQVVKSKSWRKLLVVTSDAHIPKAKFFFDFVFGKEYDISYESSVLNLTKEQLKMIREKEKKSIEIMKEIYEDKKIKSGEDEKIGKLLKEFYSRYD